MPNFGYKRNYLNKNLVKVLQEYPYHIVYPPKGYQLDGHVVDHVPHILTSAPRSHIDARAYLIDRAFGRWPAGTPRVVYPSRLSLKTYAANLANFLEWAERRGVDMLTCTYQLHVQGRYQREMLEGIWCARGKGLSPGTVNARVDAAVSYLSWLVAIGKRREPFGVPTEIVKVSYGTAVRMNRSIKEVKVRVGVLRTPTGELNLPSRAEVRDFIAQSREAVGEDGPVFSLMTEMLFLSGIRREELVCLRKDLLPEDKAQWQVVGSGLPVTRQQVQVTLQFGTKGRELGRCPLTGDKLGNQRNILIPMLLALKLHDYECHQRLVSLNKALKAVKPAQRVALRDRTPHLFLRADGRRWTGQSFFDAWKKVPMPPSGRIHPHTARHWWACTKLQARIIESQAAHQSGTLPVTAMSIIQLEIQPQLGHSDSKTTEMYVRWLTRQQSTPVMLDGEDE